MIPILYEKDETLFTANGLGRLPDCTNCIVTEERNGVFEITFDYPVDGVNYENIQLGRIIAVSHESDEDIQPFDIVSCSRPINGLVTFFGTHVSYRMNNLVTWGTNVNNLTDAIAMLNRAVPSQPFTITADFLSGGFMAAADGKPRTVREMLGGVEGSILDTYGGEFKFDKFSVKIMRERGKASNLTIRYGLNLTEYKEEVDISESFSSVVPFWSGETLVRGGLIKSGMTSLSGRETTVPLDLTDKFEEQPTVAEIENFARNYLYNSEPYIPKQTIDVNFANLADFQEYAELAPLLDADLCDTVKVVFPLYDMEGTFKIVKTEYDVLAERYTTMTLGKLSTNLAEALGINNGLGGGGVGSNTPPKSLSLGQYTALGILTSSGGFVMFSIPTGRAYPPGTTIQAISFGVVARASVNYNDVQGNFFIKSASGGSSAASFNSASAFTFYNGANQSKSLDQSSIAKTLQGGTNIQITMSGGTDFFSGNETTRKRINNQACSFGLNNIIVTFNIPSNT